MKMLLKGSRIAVIICLIACNEQSTSGISAEQAALYKQSDQQAANVGDQLVAGNTSFAVTLFQALLAESADENIFISPISLSVALAMTMNGAVGETYDGMTNTLALNGMEIEDINSQMKSLLSSLEHTDQDVTLTLANSIWKNPDYPIKDSFLECVETWYQSGVYDADSIDSVNAWIEEKTGGKITDMLKTFPADFVMFLINAIYFKGDWTTTFDRADTDTQTFTLADNSTVDVEMMGFTERKPYTAYIGEHVIGIRLSYGRGKIAFYGFAPLPYSEGPSIDEFIATLDGESLAAVLEMFKEQELDGVYLPKFKLIYEKKLQDILKALGMEAAFKGGFDKMTDPALGNPVINEVWHKSFIEVNEEGTEAAAATVVEMVDESAGPMFVADKPFFFLIRDDRNGTILFMGKVANPQID